MKKMFYSSFSSIVPILPFYCIHIHIYIYICGNMCIYIYTFVRICVYIYIYIHRSVPLLGTTSTLTDLRRQVVHWKDIR